MHIVHEDNVNIQEIVTALHEGKTLVYPTETCYGLGCDATNAQAVEKVFQIKQRQQEKSVLVLMSDIAMAKEYVLWNEQLEDIAERYWPGPVTVVAQKRDDLLLPEGIVAPDGTIAFRVSSHEIPLAIVEQLQKPLVSTSANISSHASPYDIATVLTYFQGQEAQPDYIIDGGVLPEQASSTIVHIDPNRGIHIVRQGGVVVSLE